MSRKKKADTHADTRVLAAPPKTAPVAVQPDERKHLPSASGFERLALCPGSWQAERGLPEERSDVADAGTRIHAAYEGQQVALKEGEDWVLGELLRETDALLERLQFTGDEVQEVKETRLWYVAREGRLLPEQLFSGKADRIYLHERRALIIDAKTGYEGATDAARNWQLRALAVILGQQIELDEVIVAILQPRVNPAVTLASYSAPALKAAEQSCLEVLDRAARPDAPRVPGEKQCAFCKFRHQCPERNGQALALLEQMPVPALLTPERIAAVLPRIAFAEKVFADIKSMAKDAFAQAAGLAKGDAGWDWGQYPFDAQPAAVPGYQLKQGARQQEIDAARLWGNIEASGLLEPEEFIACCEVGLGKLRETLATKHGLKGKTLKDKVDGLLAGATAESRKAPSLEALE